MKSISEYHKILHQKTIARISPNLNAFWQEKHLKVWILAIFVGIIVGLAASLFRLAIGWVQWLWIGSDSELGVLDLTLNLSWYHYFFPPIIGGVIIGFLLKYFAPLSRPEGVADVIEARTTGGKDITWSRSLWTAIIAVISLGAGASAGREGPMVHFGASLSSLFARRFDLSKMNLKALFAAGVAGAISASFNAPIAGIVFAHEVILQHYSPRVFVPVVISSAIASVIARIFFGSDVVFSLPDYDITSYWEVPAFMLLGVTCAVASILFQFSLIWADWTVRQFPKMPLMFKPIIAGVMLGAIGMFLPEVLGVGYGTTNAALNQQLTIGFMILLIFTKTIATSITIAGKFGGGIFSPTLYVGAMVGGAYGLIAASVFPDLASNHGAYAILGMGAVAASVLGAPFSTILIVFELTGGYALSLALMLTIAISNGLHNAVHGRCFFHYQLEIRGQFLHEGPHREISKHFTVKDILDNQEELYDGDTGESVLLEDQVHLTPEKNIGFALRLFDSSGQNRLPVVALEGSKTIIGYVFQIEALRLYNKELIVASQEEHK